MTFEEAIQLHLERFDKLTAEIRVMVADPKHLNIESAEMKTTWNDLYSNMRDNFALKDWMDTARRMKAEKQPKP